MPHRSLKQEFHDLARLREIISILAENGFQAYLNHANLLHHAKLKSRIAAEEKDQNPALFRETLEALGPTFIKLGQLLSIRPDLIPPEYCQEFRKLQDHVIPLSSTVIKSRVQAEIKQPINKVFTHFDEKPLASASVSQVHKATLKDGTKVALKIQRPGIRDLINTDTDIMDYIAKKLDKRYPKLHASQIVDEFRTYSKRELDFQFEARTAKKFGNYFEGDEEIVIPQVYEEYSTKSLLVLEAINGVKVNDKKALKKAGHSLSKLAHIGFRAIFEQVFDLGIFHADQHPGNLLATKSGKTEQLVILDFGIVGFLDRETQDLFIRFYMAMISGDAQDVTEVILKLGEKGPNSNPQELKRIISTLLLDWNGTTLGEERVSTLFHKIVQACVDQDIHLPPDVVLVAKAFLTVEGVAIWLNPKFNLTEESKPLIENLKEQRFSRATSNFSRDALRTYEVAKDIPKNANRALERLASGKISINIDETIFHKAAIDLDLEMSKRNIAFTSCAFFIGSALLAGLAPELVFLGFPLYTWGFAGFILTLFMLMFVSVKMHRYLVKEL